ncbi:MAG: putative LPS assembly protein LptD [Saprospiraceae bacterium]
MNTKIKIFYFFIIFFPFWAAAQQPVDSKGTTSTIGIKGTAGKTKIDTLGKDSLSVEITKNIQISKDALDDPVDYEAQDSIIFDNKNNLVHLYRNAVVKFQTIEVRAAYIVLNIKENLATAEPIKPPSGPAYGTPEFKDKDQNFKAGKMRYNFKTKKGIVYDVTTLQQNLHVLGEKTKFISRSATADTSDTDIIYSKDAILTTCDDPSPHYGIRAQKLKVLANKLVIVGPSNLEIGGVPTPIWLPFGFYPVSKNKQTGLLFPTNYGFQPNLGIGVQGLGWYFPLGKHYNLQVRADYYTRGNWGLYTITDYRYRYKFGGNLRLSYNNVSTEKLGVLEKDHTRTLSLLWSHNQDPAARPNQSFSANVNISTNAGSIQRNLTYDYRSAMRNILTSGVNFSKQFPGKPFSFNSGFTHSQNTQDHRMNLGFTANFPTQAMFPFRKAKNINFPEGVNDFLDQFSLNYNARAEARLSSIDSLLLRKESISNIRTGLTQSVSANAPIKVLKYITLSPNANFGQTFFFDRIKKVYKDTIIGNTEGKIDTLRYTDLVPVNTFDMGVSFNTTVFGTKQFKKGYFRGIRHKMNISGGFSFAPVLTRQSWFDSVRQVRQFSSGANQRVQYQRYSIFEGSINQVFDPGLNPKARKTLYFNLGNTLEAKVKGRKDSIAKRIRILDNFNIPVSFNLANDSMKMAHPISMGLTNNFFKGLVNVQLSWNITPYNRVKDVFGQWRYTNQKIWKTENLGKIGQFKIPKPFTMSSGNLNVSTGLTVRQMIDYLVKKEKTPNSVPDQSLASTNNNIDGLKSILSLVENFNVRYNYAIDFNNNTYSGRDTVYTSAHQVGIGGNIPLSTNWNINIGNIGYDFKNKGLPYIDIGITRNLHCWELSGSWQPTRNSFFFTLKVKQAPLDFLKLPIQKGNSNSFRGF